MSSYTIYPSNLVIILQYKYQAFIIKKIEISVWRSVWCCLWFKWSFCSANTRKQYLQVKSYFL